MSVPSIPFLIQCVKLPLLPACSRADRGQFNANLLNIFSNEYGRVKSVGSAALEPRGIADWKFRELDRDRSGALHKAEYRGLRRLIKKVK